MINSAYMLPRKKHQKPIHSFGFRQRYVTEEIMDECKTARDCGATLRTVSR